MPPDLIEGDGVAEVARAPLEHVEAPEHLVRLQPGSFKVPTSTYRCHLAADRLSTHGDTETGCKIVGSKWRENE